VVAGGDLAPVAEAHLRAVEVALFGGS